LYSDISTTVGVNITLVRKICEKQFKTASKMIKDERNDCVKFPYIGKMYKKYDK
tara:strand:+ start:297 stop:458 length:162 start_codon:yes stop_codon:yes gene_type:complete